MARSQRDFAGTGTDADVDTIDLTKSSPEPEPRRLPSQPKQQQLPNYLQRQPRPYSMSRKPSGAGPTANLLSHQTRPINPKHIKDIIDTCNPTELRKVLFSLCQMSPALTGAIARGLAPHSLSAQQLIRQHRNGPSKSAAKARADQDSDIVYARAKNPLLSTRKLPGSRTAAPKSRSPRPLTHIRGAAGSQATSSRIGVHPAPQVKREIAPSLSSSDQDDDYHLPGAFPRTTSNVSSSRPRLQDNSRNSASVNRAPTTTFVPRLSVNTQKAKPTEKKCIQCHETFGDDSGVCMWHLGRKIKGQHGGQGVWSCCNAPASDPGCHFGSHLAEEEIGKDDVERKRPSASHQTTKSDLT